MDSNAMEAALRAKERYLERLEDVADVIVLELDPQGRIVHYNRFMEELCQRPLAEARGKDWFSTFLPEGERERTRALFEQAIGGADVHGNVNAIVTKAGVERYIQWSGTTLRDDDNAVVKHIAMGIDVSEQHAAAEAIRMRDARLHELIQATQDGVVFIDGHSGIRRFNAAAEQMFGYSAAEVLGQPVTMLMPEPHASEHHGYIERYERTGDARVIGSIRVVTAKRKSGETFPAELTITPLAPNELRYAAFIRDVSERMKLQAELLDSERLAAVGATARVFAHEVGNPLNNVYLYAQLLGRRLAKLEGGDALRPTVDNVMAEVERLNGLLDAFRSFSSATAVEPGPVDVQSFVEHVCQLQRQEIHIEGAIEVACDVPEQLRIIHGSRDALIQALSNLCDNALEAMPDGGTLTLRARMHDDAVRIEVHDTGAGVDSELEVFAPFVSSKPNGTGLGLPEALQIIKGHGGTLSFESEPGHTCFSVVLPVNGPPASMSSPG